MERIKFSTYGKTRAVQNALGSLVMVAAVVLNSIGFPHHTLALSASAGVLYGLLVGVNLRGHKPLVSIIAFPVMAAAMAWVSMWVSSWSHWLVPVAIWAGLAAAALWSLTPWASARNLRSDYQQSAG